MGFEEDVRHILSHCPDPNSGRRTCMFSATWPASIQRMAMEYMIDPIRIYVGFDSVVRGGDGDDDGHDRRGTNAALEGGGRTTVVDDSLAANRRVHQIVEVMEDRARQSRLLELLRTHHRGNRNGGTGGNRVLIFALYKKEAERLETWLQRTGGYANCTSIHGNKNQVLRTRALEEFKNGTCPLLVATDVAARGLDIPNVELVINYTFPLSE